MNTLALSTVNIKEELIEKKKRFSMKIENESILTEAIIKCGEVIFKNETLLFTCNFCENKFLKIKFFVYHFMTLHLDNNLSDNILQQIFDEVDYSVQDFNEDTLNIKDSPKWNTVNGNIDDLTNKYENKVEKNRKVQYFNNKIVQDSKNRNDDLNLEEDDANYVYFEKQIFSAEDEDKLKKDDLKNKYENNQKIQAFNEKNVQDPKDNNFDLNYEDLVEYEEDSFPEEQGDTLKKLNCINNEIKKSLVCEVCNKSFRRLCDYKRHEKGGHGPDGGKKKYKYKYDIQRFICETCGKAFKTNYHLKQHQHVHTGERPYKCELCPQTFAKRRHMVFHMRYHLNDRRYKCQYCDKAFVEHTKRRLHEMIHTGTFPFKCSFCDKGFRCRSKLNVHIKRHENDRMFKCDKCEKSFFDIKLLREHAVVHSDEKPFVCDICPARFPRKGALRLHMHLHSDKKKYSCKICGKEFHQYNGIYTHMKSHGIKYSTAYEKGECDGKNDNNNTK